MISLIFSRGAVRNLGAGAFSGVPITRTATVTSTTLSGSLATPCA